MKPTKLNCFVLKHVDTAEHSRRAVRKISVRKITIGLKKNLSLVLNLKFLVLKTAS